jgi:hypothetical protein
LIETDASTIEEAAAAAVAALTGDPVSTGVQGKCTRPFAQSADRNVKFLSSRQKESLFFVESVSRKKDHKEIDSRQVRIV